MIYNIEIQILIHKEFVSPSIIKLRLLYLEIDSLINFTCKNSMISLYSVVIFRFICIWDKYP